MCSIDRIATLPFICNGIHLGFMVIGILDRLLTAQIAPDLALPVIMFVILFVLSTRVPATLRNPPSNSTAFAKAMNRSNSDLEYGYDIPTPLAAAAAKDIGEALPKTPPSFTTHHEYTRVVSPGDREPPNIPLEHVTAVEKSD